MGRKPPPKAPRANHSAHLSSKLSTSSNLLLTSSFSPSGLHLSLFASTILGLDSQRLRIHDTLTSRLRWEIVLDKGIAINSLTWGTIPPLLEDQKKHRKKRKRTTGNEDGVQPTVAVAATTSVGNIVLYSPTEGGVLGVLEGAHLGEVRQFIFSDEGIEGRGWSVGADGRLVEWDLRRKLTMRSINLPDASIQRLAYAPPSILCASHTVYSIDYENPGMKDPPTLGASTTPIHTVVVSEDKHRFLSAAESDRFINVFSLTENRHTGALVAETDVRITSVYNEGHVEVLVAVTIDGAVELFNEPFAPISAGDTSAPSRKRKSLTRKADALVKVVRPASHENVTIVDASLQGEDLVVAWVESGVNMEFETLRWTSPEDRSLALSGLVEISKTKRARIDGGASLNGAKDMGKIHVNESQAVVIGGTDIQDIDMEDPADEAGPAGEDEVGEDVQAISSDDEGEPEEPTFGDRVQALKASSATTVPGSGTALVKPTSKTVGQQLQPPSSRSLATVLAQALQTDDKSLLESCLQTGDQDAILATIRRLNSTSVVKLIERLAERLARRPGRAATMGIWVRLAMVAHGGYLASLPDIMGTLASLHSIVGARAGSLPRLLALQGRLDMLSSQLEFRKSLGAGQSSKEEVDDEEDVLYVEGQEKESAGEEESDEEPEEVGMKQLQIEDASYIGSRESSDEDMVNGVDGSGESELGDGESESESSESGAPYSDEDEDEDEDQFNVHDYLNLEASDDNPSHGEDEEEEAEDGEGIDDDGESVSSMSAEEEDDEEEDEVDGDTIVIQEIGRAGAKARGSR